MIKIVTAKSLAKEIDAHLAEALCTAELKTAREIYHKVFSEHVEKCLKKESSLSYPVFRELDDALVKELVQLIREDSDTRSFMKDQLRKSLERRFDEDEDKPIDEDEGNPKKKGDRK